MAAKRESKLTDNDIDNIYGLLEYRKQLWMRFEALRQEAKRVQAEYNYLTPKTIANKMECTESEVLDIKEAL